MSRPAVRERKPRKRSNAQARRISVSKSSDSEPSGLRKYVKSSSINGDSLSTLGRKHSNTDNGYDAGLDTDDANDDGKDEVAAPYRRDRRRSSPLNSFLYPEPIPSNRFGGFLRALARSLQHCSMRIAAGFGLSRQQAAWYKNCWNTPGSQSKSVHLLSRQTKIRQVSVPSLVSKSQANPRSVTSSTTL
ncbi:uncharacterized protein LOC123038001 [Drosophila rhopaloa]|uniref:Uncharacterized protein n=1 Tax=Drosophila rhopaloa TaxID=1041015 RepID=A0ABM5JEJ9_DRORH|nr:uncharacterized protein LOC123038001 [Drosophila rhopaloa]